LVTKFKVWKIISDPKQRSAAVHATAVGDTPLGVYENEHVFFLSFTDDGKKVNRVEEYVDTSYSEDFVKKVKEYQARNTN
jgi:ketosteroid isomerase-like protein